MTSWSREPLHRRSGYAESVMPQVWSHSGRWTVFSITTVKQLLLRSCRSSSASRADSVQLQPIQVYIVCYGDGVLGNF